MGALVKQSVQTHFSCLFLLQLSKLSRIKAAAELDVVELARVRRCVLELDAVTLDMRLDLWLEVVRECDVFFNRRERAELILFMRLNFQKAALFVDVHLHRGLEICRPGVLQRLRDVSRISFVGGGSAVQWGWLALSSGRGGLALEEVVTLFVDQLTIQRELLVLRFVRAPRSLCKTNLGTFVPFESMNTKTSL